MWWGWRRRGINSTRRSVHIGSGVEQAVMSIGLLAEHEPQALTQSDMYGAFLQ